MTCWIEVTPWKGICEERADYGRFGDDLILKYIITESDSRDKATWIYFQVPLLTWAVERNGDFLVWEIELFEYDRGSMSPRTGTVRVESSVETLVARSVSAAEGRNTLGLMPLVWPDVSVTAAISVIIDVTTGLVMTSDVNASDISRIRSASLELRGSLKFSCTRKFSSHCAPCCKLPPLRISETALFWSIVERARTYVSLQVKPLHSPYHEVQSVHLSEDAVFAVPLSYD